MCDTSNVGRKLGKKMDKVFHILTRELRIKRSRKPTNFVMVWGAGHAHRTCKKEILEFFSPPPFEIRYYAEKPYFTARYMSKKDAADAIRHKNGIVFSGTTNHIYSAFIDEESVVPSEDSCLIGTFDTPWPQGLEIIPNFISEKEERELLLELFRDEKHFNEPQDEHEHAVENEGAGDSETDEDEEGGRGPITKYMPNDVQLRNRIVRHYGYEFRYGRNDINFYEPLPESMPNFFDKYFQRMMSSNILERKPEQITMNYYGIGHGIPPHVDSHESFEEPILSLSLGSSVVMDFRTQESHLSVILPPRSLLCMFGEARYFWSHGIATHRFDTIPDQSGLNLGVDILRRDVRVSLTFRLLNFRHTCSCPYPETCDARRRKTDAEQLEKDLVHNVYDDIASHFSATRHKPWPRVKTFVERLTEGQTFLDIGCGNGKYFNLAKYVYQVGMDMNKLLLQIAKDMKNIDGVRGNCLKLPFKNDSFDAVICIAVLHHLSTEERRIEALQEIYRVLAPGGHALVYVWAKDQKMNDMKSVYARQKAVKAGKNPDSKPEYPPPPPDYSFLPVHVHEENFQFNDMLVPWMTRNSGPSPSVCKHRFYHVFNTEELQNLIMKIQSYPPPQILESYYDQGNWCVEFYKKNPNLILTDPILPETPTVFDTSPETMNLLSLTPNSNRNQC